MDEDLGCLGQRLFWMNASVGNDLNDQFLVVCLLFDPEVFNAVLDVLDRRVNAVDENGAKGCIALLVLFCGHITAALLDGQLHFKLHALVQVADHLIGVEYLKARSELSEVACGDLFLSGEGGGHCFPFVFLDLSLESNLLEIEHDLRHIFNYALNSAELMFDATDAQGSEGKTFERAQQNTADRIAHCEAVARF
ncbi:MAG: Uncharacterised protein [Flavobacteriia bacterium]|nr:MAG: Uncharacterised protein [Flavobacteriia bacterium]